VNEVSGLRARKKQESRRKIVAEAERLFRERGYERVRMIDIAQAAEVSEPTLYNYFPSKEHLIFDMDQELEERIVACIKGVAPSKALVEAVRKESLRFLGDLSRSGAGKATHSAIRPAKRGSATGVAPNEFADCASRRRNPPCGEQTEDLSNYRTDSRPIHCGGIRGHSRGVWRRQIEREKREATTAGNSVSGESDPGQPRGLGAACLTSHDSQMLRM